MILTVTLNAAIDKRYVSRKLSGGRSQSCKGMQLCSWGKDLNVPSRPLLQAEIVATGFVGGHAGTYIEDALKPLWH
ncbi:MAG: hypothetical protein ACLU4P_00585 [Ruminococcus sp.]